MDTALMKLSALTCLAIACFALSVRVVARFALCCASSDFRTPGVGEPDLPLLVLHRLWLLNDRLFSHRRQLVKEFQWRLCSAPLVLQLRLHQADLRKDIQNLQRH